MLKIKKMITYQKAKEILLLADLLNKVPQPTIKRYEQFIKNCFKKKALQILLDETMDVFESAFKYQKVRIKIERINEEEEFGFETEIIDINSKTENLTLMESIMLENSKEAFENLDLEAVFEGATSKLLSVFIEADNSVLTKMNTTKKKMTPEEAFANYLLVIFQSKAFEIEGELIESKNSKSNNN